jgi:hypothetical protein
MEANIKGLSLMNIIVTIDDYGINTRKGTDSYHISNAQLSDLSLMPAIDGEVEIMVSILSYYGHTLGDYVKVVKAYTEEVKKFENFYEENL